MERIFSNSVWMKNGSYWEEFCGKPKGVMSEMSFSTAMRTVLDHDCGRMNVTAVVVKTTRRKTARMTIFRIRIMRQ